MTAPQSWQQLLEAEQAHWVSHAEPILARYSANEQQVWAVSAGLQQQQQADTEQIGVTLQHLALVETPAAAAAAAAAKPQPPVLAPHPVGSTASLASEADCDIILVTQPELEAPAGTEHAAKQQEQKQQEQAAIV
jgi:hypothetical protein